MVNQSALERIISYSNNQRLREMKRWSERNIFRNNRPTIRHDFSRKMISNIRRILNLFSGNDLVNMLKGLIFMRFN
jgi:hypothetical protein